MVFQTSQTVLWLALIGVVAWLGGVTYLLLRALSNYNRLTRGVSENTLSQLLTQFIGESKLTQEELHKVRGELQKLNRAGMSHVQKLGLVRFNPFSDTGGDQSFTLAMLDGNNNGMIITSLYARTGVRWYIKTIREGKGVEHELSKEEKEALKKVHALEK